MFWDGSRWVDETPKPTQSLASAKRRRRDWAATGFMALALVGLIVPSIGVFAAPTGSTRAVSSWSDDYKVTSYQENSAKIHYTGRWSRRDHRSYSGGHVRSTTQRGAKAIFSFTGTAVAWLGPIGPSRGKASVYLDGTYVKTVNMYAPRFDPTAVLFRRTFAENSKHTLKIVAQGTRGHATVAIDRFVVRGDSKLAAYRKAKAAREAALVIAPAPSAESTPVLTPDPAAQPTPAMTPDPAAAPTPAPTAVPTAAPTPAPTTTPTAAPTPVPTVAPATSGGRTVTVASIAALKSALADDSVGEIVVKDGTYHVSPSSQVKADSLWIGSAASGGIAYNERTRPILVRAETRGGVTFDGGGGSAFGGLSFEDGAHHQTWDGFNFANMAASKTGIIEVGGYTPRRSPHHITLRHITMERSCTGRATTADGSTWDHGVYIAHALDTGPHDLLFEDITVDGRGGLASAFHFYHSEPGAPNASNVIIRRLHVTGTQQAIILWDDTLRNITFDHVDITGALAYAVRVEYPGTGILLSNTTSTGSGYQGFHSSSGANPPGVTFANTSLR